MNEKLSQIQEHQRTTLAKPILLTLSQVEFTKVALSQKRLSKEIEALADKAGKIVKENTKC